MTITKEVQDQLIDTETRQPRYMPARATMATASTRGSTTTSPVGSNSGSNGNNGTPWTEDEHERFLVGLELFPSGPWKSIANCVGTRSARQTMSHAQKYRQKLRRWEYMTARSDSKFAENIAEQHLQQFNEEELAQQQRQAQQQIDPNGSTPPAAVAPVVAASAMTNFMTDVRLDLHLTSEQIDEIIMSLFDEDDQPLFLSSDDLEWLRGSE